MMRHGHGRCGGMHMGPGRWGDRHGGHGGWGRERGGGRGRRRMFDGGELRLVLLKLIADDARHGYDLIREIEDLTGGAYAPSPGVVYPTLTLLGDMGLIEEQAAEGTRKKFAITDAGRAHLDENVEEVAALMARLAQVGEMRERTDGAPIRRAMGNLRQVLQHRLTRDDVGVETLLDVAAIIDEAAQKIERLK
ncbi:PadR family transcriptional regulator [Hephaestia caeni]|uniref:PadR family transcriptional regulator n=2 Tax=Hephaestia caeni TaxID=645617 RepID=A0A397NHX8_9SPHN|nr:PadR family transcriptional regulator [Hephaestia caeni]